MDVGETQGEEETSETSPKQAQRFERGYRHYKSRYKHYKRCYKQQKNYRWYLFLATAVLIITFIIALLLAASLSSARSQRNKLSSELRQQRNELQEQQEQIDRLRHHNLQLQQEQHSDVLAFSLDSLISVNLHGLAAAMFHKDDNNSNQLTYQLILANHTIPDSLKIDFFYEQNHASTPLVIDLSKAKASDKISGKISLSSIKNPYHFKVSSSED